MKSHLLLLLAERSILEVDHMLSFPMKIVAGIFNKQFVSLNSVQFEFCVQFLIYQFH